MGRPEPGRVLRRALIAMACVLGWALAPAAAHAAYATPALSVPQAQLDASLQCSGDLSGAGRTPVLLVPGTTLNPEDQFSFSYYKAFRATGRPYCAVTVPQRGMGDIQTAAEYVVNGIRFLHAKAGRRIDVLGHSQGGMSPRWALKYFPDTRAMVDDLVALTPSNHGTLTALAICPLEAGVPCSPSIFQQRAGSAFMTALNDGPETFPGVSYTVAYSRSDEIVTPNLDEANGSSSLRTGGGARTNIAVQELCGLNYLSEHLVVGSYDAAGYAIATDALDHDGPADRARVLAAAPAACNRPPAGPLNPALPGVDVSTLATDFAREGVLAATTLVTAERVAAEPALKPYVAAYAAAGGAVQDDGSATTTTPAPPAQAGTGTVPAPSGAGTATATVPSSSTATPSTAGPATTSRAARPALRLLTTPATAARTGRARLRIRCASACSGRVALRIGGRTYASRSYRLSRSGLRTYTLRLGPKARRALAAPGVARRLSFRL